MPVSLVSLRTHANSHFHYIATPWQHDNFQITIDGYAKANTLTTVHEMVLNDMGVALYPEFLAQADLASGRMVRVLPKVRGRAWHFYFLHQYKSEKPIHVSRFYQLLTYYFNKSNTVI